MKIVLDLRSIINLESGDGQFSSQIIKHLAAIDGRNEYILYTRKGNRGFYSVDKPNFELRVVDIAAYSLTEEINLAKIVNRHKPDIYHTFTFSYPSKINCRTMISMYDLTHLLFSSLFSFKLILYYKLRVARCVERADKILTLSEKSKLDIINKFKVDSKKIRPIYCGVNPLYRQIDKDQANKYVKEKFSISSRFLLYVGQIKRHKNIQTILYSLRDVLKAGVEIKLVICGRNSTKSGWLLKIIAKLDIKKSVILIETPTNNDLLNLYNAADIFVYPSLNEGFGLPPLEAMSCGVPVVSSNVGSLPEVLGKSASFVGPQDVAGFSDAITRILCDKEKAQNLFKSGLERSRFFSWEKAARDLLNLYEEII